MTKADISEVLTERGIDHRRGNRNGWLGAEKL
nr:MAG TPA: dimeris T4 recombination endonuclease VII [Caudoviricetes sp.]